MMLNLSGHLYSSLWLYAGCLSGCLWCFSSGEVWRLSAAVRGSHVSMLIASRPHSSSQVLLLHSSPSSRHVSGPACTCCAGCCLVHHAAGPSNKQASGEVAQTRCHHCSVRTPDSMEAEGGGSFLCLFKALCRDESPPVSCCDDEWPPQALLQKAACSISVAHSQLVGYPPPDNYCGSHLLAEVTVGSSAIHWCVSNPLLTTQGAGRRCAL